MSSASSCSANDSYGQGGWQYSSSYNDSQQPAQGGMTTQPSVGRFTEQEKATSMFAKKPATPTVAPLKVSSLSSGSGGIVNLRADSCPEGKMNMYSSKGKK